MPTICNFNGILIMMYLKDKEHNPPYVHAFTQDFDAPFLIENGELIEGDFPLKARKQVKDFIVHYRDELMNMWNTGIYTKLNPID